VRRTLLIVLALNAVVAVVKLIVGARTGSLTVLGAALESGLDMFNNVMGITIVAVAGQAPDENHPYGHDKFETLGALAIVGFLSITCFELLRSGVSALMSNRAPDHIESSDIAVITATLIVNAFVVWYERRRGRELGSMFLLADAAHTGSDILVTLMAIASLVLTRFGSADRVERLSDPPTVDSRARRRTSDRREQTSRRRPRGHSCSGRATDPLPIDRVRTAFRGSHDRRSRVYTSRRSASTRRRSRSRD
jgi:cation diffusion facilitator family transporter